MGIRKNIIERFEFLRNECLKKDAMPSVIIGVGVNPEKPSTYRHVVVVTGLESLVLTKQALEDGLKLVNEQIQQQKGK